MLGYEDELQCKIAALKKENESLTVQLQFRKEEIEGLNEEVTELKGDLKFLDCLYACGVDSWEGFGFAHEMYQEMYQEEADG